MYHLMVLMVECGITWDDVYDRLLERKGIKSEKLSKLMKKEVKE